MNHAEIKEARTLLSDAFTRSRECSELKTAGNNLADAVDRYFSNESLDGLELADALYAWRSLP